MQSIKLVDRIYLDQLDLIKYFLIYNNNFLIFYLSYIRYIRLQINIKILFIFFLI